MFWLLFCEHRLPLPGLNVSCGPLPCAAGTGRPPRKFPAYFIFLIPAFSLPPPRSPALCNGALPLLQRRAERAASGSRALGTDARKESRARSPCTRLGLSGDPLKVAGSGEPSAQRQLGSPRGGSKSCPASPFTLARSTTDSPALHLPALLLAGHPGRKEEAHRTE